MTWTYLDIAQAVRAHVDHAREHPEDTGRSLQALAELAEDLSPEAGPVKRCGCGRVFTADAWEHLPFVGVQDDGTERLELRNCPACKSTISVVLGPSTAACVDAAPRVVHAAHK